MFEGVSGADALWNTFSSIVSTLIATFVPLKRVRAIQKPKYTLAVSRALRHKALCHRRYMRSPTRFNLLAKSGSTAVNLPKRFSYILASAKSSEVSESFW